MLHRAQVTNTSQYQLRESGLHGLIAAKKAPLKDINKKKRLAWAKKHEQWTLDGGNLSFGLMCPKESDGVLHQITWPPQSPDLNPVEMVWDELDGK